MRLRLETKAALFLCLLMAAGFGAALMLGFQSQPKSLLEMAAQRYLAIADNLGNQILRQLDMTITPVRDETGAIVNHVSILRDATQQLVLPRQHRQAQKV